ncbi:MAG: hypothetical protein ACUVX8_09850 [Candidatus Zipacnadales bacterium]
MSGVELIPLIGLILLCCGSVRTAQYREMVVRYFGGPAGTTGEIRTQFTPKEYDDYYVYPSMNGEGTIALEEVRLIEERECGGLGSEGAW